MGNCLKTQLKASVSNNTLDKLTQLRFVSPAVPANTEVSTYILNRSEDMLAEIISGNGYFKVNGANRGTSYTIPKDEGLFYIVHTDTNPVTFRVDGFANINSFSNCYTDLDRLFLYSRNMAQISSSYTDVSGLMKLKNLSNLPTSLINFVLYKSTIGYLVSGSVSDLANCASLTVVTIEDNGVITGQLSDLSPCVNLSSLNLINQNITGSVESLGDAMAPNRDSGVILLRLFGNSVTLGGEPIPYTCYLRFGSDMIDPSPEESGQGWQVSY